VLVPGNSGYDAARKVYNERYADIRPPAVVQVRDAADVAAVVRWANRFDVALVARSGGHAYDGSSTSRSHVVVDLGRLDGVRLSGGVATVGPAAQVIDIVATLARRGAAVALGSCPTVGVGGLVLGGGMGLAGRAWGLTLDNVRAFDVVDATGKRRRVDADSAPDLFWALRGGGAGFAIVTAVRLRARAAPSASYFSVSFPRGARAEALAAWDGFAPSAPNALMSIFSLQAGGATAFGQYLGSERALRRLVAPLARVPGASLSTGGAGWLALQRRWAGCADGGLASCRRDTASSFAASSAYFARRLGANGRGAFVAAANTGAIMLLDAYGGAVNEVPASATAFVHRNVRFSVQLLSYASEPVARGRVQAARQRIAPFSNGQAYQNYPDPTLRDPLAAYYGANLPRLRAIKAQVDPDGIFARSFAG
jgi:FAD/FMN-containing dehydrogenase